MTRADEWQFDGLVGPTHNYAGLSPGNVASLNNAGAVSNPREAALQGIEKMWFVRSLGMKQAFLPPQTRPLLAELRKLGFSGDTAKMLDDAHRTAPDLLAAVYSSSYMWRANAATIAPSADTRDGRVHMTPANLISHFHRAIEPLHTTAQLRKIFADEKHFAVHDPLVGSARFSDEGAANHMRVCARHGDAGTHVFVYGTGHGVSQKPKKFVARQTREAFEAMMRLHQLDPAKCVFAQQHPDAIDAGVFHHDVIGMNTTRLMLQHEMAILEKQSFGEAIKKQSSEYIFDYIEITNKELPAEDAVKSYFFNSQLLELPSGEFVIVAPSESQETASAHDTLSRLSSGNGPISKVHYLNVRESMRNGGGPACLRLRIVLTDEEASAMHQGIVMDDDKYMQLKAWVRNHYRDRMCLDDLRDPLLIDEVEEAMHALTAICGI